MASLNKGIHSGNNRPIVFISGDTYPIYKQLGRSGLGFTWWGAKKIWWMYETSFNNNTLSGLQKLGVDTSAYSSAPQQPTMPPNGTGVPPQPPKPSSLTNKTGVDPDAPAMKYYGFPVKQDIYSVNFNANIDGQDYPMTITMDRSFVKGQRKVPIYYYSVKYKGEVLGKIKENAPGDWGTYDEDALASGIVDRIQARFNEKEKSKMYKKFKDAQELEKRDPTFAQFLNDWYELKYKDKEKVKQIVEENIEPVFIYINQDGYDNNFPIEIDNLAGTLYFHTVVEHPLAPYHETLGSLDITPAIKTIDELNQAIQNYLNKDQEKIKQKYIKYLKSFPYKEEEQQQSSMEMQSIVDMIVKNFVDLPKIKEELISRGFIREKLRGEGWVITKEAVNAGYSRKNDANQFYGAIAYWLHRKQKNITSITEMMLTTTISDLANLIKRYGHSMSYKEIDHFIEGKIVNPLFVELFNRRPPKSVADNYADFYGGFGSGRGGAGTNQPSSAFTAPSALNNFVNYAVELGANEEETRNNPKDIYRKLSLQYHPGSTTNANLPPEKVKELEKTFSRLSQLFNALPPEVKMANNWYEKIIFAQK